jgi:hypothetical protein
VPIISVDIPSGNSRAIAPYILTHHPQPRPWPLSMTPEPTHPMRLEQAGMSMRVTKRGPEWNRPCSSLSRHPNSVHAPSQVRVGPLSALATSCTGFGVWALGVGTEGYIGFGFRVQCLGFRDYGLVLCVACTVDARNCLACCRRPVQVSTTWEGDLCRRPSVTNTVSCCRLSTPPACMSRCPSRQPDFRSLR